MAIPDKFDVTYYGTVSPPSQASIRAEVFEWLTDVEPRLLNALTIVRNVMADVELVRDFVTDPAVQGDFTSAELNGLGTDRTRFLNSVATEISAIVGVSATVP